MDPPNTSKTSSASSTSAQIPNTASSHDQQDKVESLLNAVRAGDLDKVVEILNDVHIDSKDRWGRTALHKASAYGKLQVCQLLVNRHCDINAVNNIGQTALHLAARWGYSQTCSILIDAGGNVNSTDDDGNTPLMDACERGKIDTVELLLQKGGNLELQNKKGESAFDLALKNGHLETAEKINPDKHKLLLYCIEKNYSKSFVTLPPELRDLRYEKNNTSLIAASKHGRARIVRCLLKQGIDVSAVNDDGDSALHLAAENGHIRVINHLLEQGASLQCQNNKGFTPEVSAKLKGRKKISEYIAKVRNEKENEEQSDSYYDAPTPMPMTPGTFEHLLEDDDVADVIDSDLPDTDDESSHPSTSGYFSPLDSTLPTNTSLPGRTISSLPAEHNFAIPANPPPRLEQAKMTTQAQYNRDDGFTSKIEQLKMQLAAEKRKNAEKDKVITEKKQKLTEKDQKLNEKDEVIAQKKEQLSQKDDQLEAKNQIIAEKKEKLAGKGEKINKQNTTIEGKGKKIKDLTETIAEKGKELKQVCVRNKSLGKLLYETNDDFSTMIIEKTEQKQRMHSHYQSNEATTAAEPYADDDAVAFSLEGDFKLSDTDLFNTGKVMSKAVCYIKWPTGCGSGFVVGSLKDQGNPNTEYYFLITCSHLLNTGLSHAVNDNPHLSTAKAIFKFDLNSASKTEVKIMRSIVSDTTLDYALLCLHHDDNLSRELQQEHVLGQYIRSPTQPKHKENLVLIGHPEPDTETKSVDCAVLVHSTLFVKAEGNIKFPVTGNDNVRLFYKCSSFLGASGSPCFDLKAKILYSMHQGGIAHRDQTIAASRSQKYEYEYGGLLYEILRDIQQQIISGQCTNLNLYGFKVLFPQYK